MTRRFLALFCITLLPAACIAQFTPTLRQNPTAPRKSAAAQRATAAHLTRGKASDLQKMQHAITVERYVTSVRFEDDGTGERELSVRMRIDTAAGAQQLRALSFRFNS